MSDRRNDMMLGIFVTAWADEISLRWSCLIRLYSRI